MKKYHLINNILGWGVCLIACIVYLITAEPTASWWDCGEYIATADKLQVGHPPGAPTFQLLGRCFTMFAEPQTAAYAVNAMSAISSGFTILFLFWTITLFGKKIVNITEDNIKDSKMWAVFASGIVGAMAYTFSDTFWYSAVEGEVYAMSSFFTAIVFWAILKWEEQADSPHSLRWLILIAFLIGVSIGVHLLNLLAIPAIVYVYYFKKYPQTTTKGFILSGIISVVLLAVVLYGIIPGIVTLAGNFEVFFVNSIGMPFNSGTIIFFVLLIALIVFGLVWSRKKNKPILNASVLSIMFLVIGYSTFFILIIRSNANTPINENAPKDAVALRAYLGREQYGSTPLFKGQYYTAQNPIGVEEGYTKYVKGKDKYEEASRAIEYVYDEKHCGVFPRMYSNDPSRPYHVQFYKYWIGKNQNDERKPTFGENLTYFFRYQVNFMYWRYFMWNFVGRQNDIQGHYFNNDGTRDYINGNWISGIKFIDEARLGPQDNLPEHLANNKARNTYFFLPLLLGLVGLFYHVKKNNKDAFIVFLLFFMTGLAIVVYLNQPPKQPRERDYAYAASFYAFAIWIGLGVMALADWLSKIKGVKHGVSTVVVFLATLILVPGVMAKENWDDHDRSDRYPARDFAQNYLKSIGKNGILITFGDNDTFPLWYTQEVEGTRTDVRILNYTLSGMYWYVEQLFNKLYESEALPFTLTKDFYGLGKDQVILKNNTTDYIEVSELLKLVKEHPERFTALYGNGEKVIVLPTKRFKITIDKPELVALGVLTQEQADAMPNEIKWELKRETLYRHQLMMLDLIGTNKFKRDINIMNPGYIKDVYPLVNSFSIQEGMVYKLTPYFVGGSKFNSDKSYDYFMNGDGTGELQWGNLNSTEIYIDDAVTKNSAIVQRQTYGVLAQQLVEEGKQDKAKDMLALSERFFPKENFPLDKYSIFFIQLYTSMNDTAKAAQYFDDILNFYEQELAYYSQFKGEKARGVYSLMQEAAQAVYILQNNATQYLDEERANKARSVLEQYIGAVRM